MIAKKKISIEEWIAIIGLGISLIGYVVKNEVRWATLNQRMIDYENTQSTVKQMQKPEWHIAMKAKVDTLKAKQQK